MSLTIDDESREIAASIEEGDRVEVEYVSAYGPAEKPRVDAGEVTYTWSGSGTCSIAYDSDGQLRTIDVHPDWADYRYRRGPDDWRSLAKDGTEINLRRQTDDD